MLGHGYTSQREEKITPLVEDLGFIPTICSPKRELTPPPAWRTDLSATLPPLLNAMYERLRSNKKDLLVNVAIIISYIPIPYLKQYTDYYLNAPISVSLDHLKEKKETPEEKEIKDLCLSTPDEQLEGVQRELKAGRRLYENDKLVLSPDILFLAKQNTKIARLLARHYGIYYTKISYDGMRSRDYSTMNLTVNEEKLHQEYIDAHYAPYAESLIKATHPATLLLNPTAIATLVVIASVMPRPSLLIALAAVTLISTMIVREIPSKDSAAFEKIAQAMQEDVQEERRFLARR